MPLLPPHQRWSVLFLLLALLVASRSLFAQAFPFYEKDTTLSDEPTTETWVLYPFHVTAESTRTLNIAVHPFFSWFKEKDTNRRDFDILWPIFSHRYRPERIGSENYSSNYLFPIYFDRRETRFNTRTYDQLILPFLFRGRQVGRGQYFIFFPLVWYANNARLAVPLFPPRPQTFIALFPVAGDFRGYWNRDRIFFLLWPVFVYSSEGKGDDFNDIYSFLWPVFGKYGGPKVNGFRVWPLFSYVQKEGEFKRATWLWPLGHYRTGRISKTNPEQQKALFFIPFYGRFIRDNIDFISIFPVYGRLEVGERISTGYALAFYNREINKRRGTREDRFGWFLVRRRTRLPGAPEELPSGEQPTTGGGVFPFYTRQSSPTRVRKNILWPVGLYKYNKYEEYTFERQYVVPIYSSQKRTFNNGEYTLSRFLFPFFRVRQSTDGTRRTNVLHLLFYNDIRSLDRTWAPLWTFWEKDENSKSGRTTVRVFKEASKYEKYPDGTIDRRLNLLLLRYKSVRQPDGTKTGHTRVLFGLFGRSKEPALRTEFLGLKF